MNGTTTNTKLLVILTFSLLAFVWVHMGMQVLNSFRSTDYWVVYHDVKPLYEAAPAGGTMKFVSTTTVNHEAPLEFLDVLYCQDPASGELERFTAQPSSKGITEIHPEESFIWPFVPLPSYSTRCCLDNFITINPDREYEKVIKFSGCEKDYYFSVIE